MQAAIASLFELEYEQVPDFKSLKEGWHNALFQLCEDCKYELEGTIHNIAYQDYKYPDNSGRKNKDRMPDIKEMPGIKGLFYASVLSPRFYNSSDNVPVTHAVIIDKNFNIVHDPNYPPGTKYPLADIIGYNGVIYFLMINPKINDQD